MGSLEKCHFREREWLVEMPWIETHLMSLEQSEKGKILLRIVD